MNSPAEKLKNLEKVGSLKREPTSREEIQGFLSGAHTYLQDSQNLANSAASRFQLAYSAAHALALVALRAHGYRPAPKATVRSSSRHCRSPSAPTRASGSRSTRPTPAATPRNTKALSRRPKATPPTSRSPRRSCTICSRHGFRRTGRKPYSGMTCKHIERYRKT